MTGQDLEENKRTKEVRERTFKVRLSETEYQYLDSHNPYGSIAKLLRQSALEKTTKIFNLKVEEANQVKLKKVIETPYNKAERTLILELSRIGNNINQIAKAVNTDVSSTGTFDKVKLLHLLISIDQQLRDFRLNDR